MQKNVLTLVAAALATVIVGACGGSKSTQPSNITYTATLNGANEKPNAITTNGTGTFTGTLNPNANTFAWVVNYSGLGSNVTLGHIHGPADANTATGVIVNFANPTGGTGTLQTGVTAGTASGSISLAGAVNTSGTVSGDSLRKLLDAGMTYANIHTSVNGGGEIRGQIHRQ
jgi:CHRD domain